MSDVKKAPSAAKGGRQRGGFGLGLVVGLLLGLGIALGVALYVTKVPVPFVDKVPRRDADLDAADAQGAKGWNPNQALGGKSRAASGVVAQPAEAASEPGKAPPPSAAAPVPAAASAAQALKPAASAAVAIPAAGAKPDPAKVTDPNAVYFVQAGAFTKPEEAEQQRARLGLQGFNAKVYEKETNGRLVYRVRIGPFEVKAEAEALHHQVQEAGLESTLVKTQK
ncbi:SPOR domain-containing protein [Inhella gelatinilytica]|uniref:SPOR domain-containing protein n=1 Tax=Inhella gelatinilytica TaxID=2795030 RepID=A0A931IRY9_9BURK|nr:SPOR domain-containing protein [Inhella gelatinilytica]MBH9551587.1 SPOR domain-containing protein [Inhella gelatinilytica]